MEILFRGKSVNNGTWVIGDGIHYPKSVNYKGTCWIDGMREKANDWVRVIPDTVGRYTGLTDKNGNRIFEGDILRYEGIYDVIDHCVVGYGKYEAFGRNKTVVGFFLYWRSDKKQYQKYANLTYWLEECEAVCVGNIHDNPELLDEKHE